MYSNTVYISLEVIKDISKKKRKKNIVELSLESKHFTSVVQNIAPQNREEAQCPVQGGHSNSFLFGGLNLTIPRRWKYDGSLSGVQF